MKYNDVSPASRAGKSPMGLRHTAVVALIGSLFGGLAAPVFAQENPQGGGHHGWRQMDPEARVDRMEHRVKRMLSRVNATEEQKARAGAIVRQAYADLRPIREKSRDGRKATIELLSRPTIDRGAIEAQRVEQLKLAEAASKRMTQALADLAEVLTPEQRAELAKRMTQRFHGRAMG
jgi:Spy/CpxP family protein refolding chaperone